MNEIRCLKQPLSGTPLKVCAYARISNDKRESEGSLEEQIEFYTDLILSNPNWTFAGIYADQGISGTTMEARKQFLTMIEKAKAGAIDIILVKSISRFARNVLNLLQVVQELTSKGVEVFFEKEGISTLDPSSTVYLTCWAQFAEEEIRSMSANKKWRDEKNFRDGVYYFNVRQMLGFRYDDNHEIQIYEPEAKWIREIFKRYAAGEKAAEIAEWLTENGVKTGKGYEKWSSSSVRFILRNEKYCGDCVMNKRYVVDPITHKTAANNGQKEKYLVRDGHPAIVSRDLFERVQAIMDSHINSFNIQRIDVTTIATSYTQFAYCPYCGSNYFSKTNSHAELKNPTHKKMLYCHSNQSRRLCEKSESLFIDDLDQIIPMQIKILRDNLPAFRKALIAAFSTDRRPEIEAEVKVIEEKILEIRKKLKSITVRTEVSIQQLCEHYRYEIKKLSRQKLKLENESLVLIDPEVRAKTIIGSLSKFPARERIGNYNFRDLFVRLVPYSRDELVFIVGNDDMTKIPKKMKPMFCGTYNYKMRCTKRTTKFGIYINQ